MWPGHPLLSSFVIRRGLWARSILGDGPTFFVNDAELLVGEVRTNVEQPTIIRVVSLVFVLVAVVVVVAVFARTTGSGQLRLILVVVVSMSFLRIDRARQPVRAGYQCSEIGQTISTALVGYVPWGGKIRGRRRGCTPLGVVSAHAVEWVGLRGRDSREWVLYWLTQQLTAHGIKNVLPVTDAPRLPFHLV